MENYNLIKLAILASGIFNSIEAGNGVSNACFNWISSEWIVIVHHYTGANDCPVEVDQYDTVMSLINYHD